MTPSTSPHLLLYSSNHFPAVTIEEGNETDEEDNTERRRFRSTSTPIHHQRTPLHNNLSSPATTIGAIVGARWLSENNQPENVAVSFNKCRPHKTTPYVVPSPNRIFKSILSGMAKLSPKPSSETSFTSSPAGNDVRWKIAATELSYKLAKATKRRDEAILEASNLKYSMAELEKKLNRLEIYCHSLKSGFEVCHGLASPLKFNQDRVIDDFLISVTESRTSIQSLSRALTIQIRQMGIKAFDRVTSLLQPYDIKIPLSRNPRTLILYLEALLNSSLFEDFESAGFSKNSVNRILNPIDRCEAQYAAFNALKELTWEDVLTKGTKHFSENFSRFCDRKMGEIMGLLGLNRSWPEPLLQAFFGASKSVWLVHLLANSVHPGLPIFRVEQGSRFDPVYMEDMGEDRAPRRLVPSAVRIMVTPGFYVYDNVIKCQVVCRYHSSGGGGGFYERA